MIKPVTNPTSFSAETQRCCARRSQSRSWREKASQLPCVHPLLPASLFTGSPQPLGGSRCGSGRDIDLQESPHGVHPVEHPQGKAEVHDGKPGGVAVKGLFQPVLEDGMSPKCGNDPELKRWEGNESKVRG